MKKKIISTNSRREIKDSLSVLAEIPAVRVKGIEAAKDFFSNIIKQISPESYKKLKIDYDEKNNINITETYEDDELI